MQSLAALCEAISRTTKKTEKIALVSAFLQANTIDDSARASVLLSGRAFPAFEETTLNVGGALLSRVLLEVTHATDHQLSISYRKHGDLGSAAFDLYAEKKVNTGAPRAGAPSEPAQGAKPQVGSEAAPPLSRSDRVGRPITLEELESKFRAIAAASGPARKADIMRDLFARATPLEAKYLTKFMGGDLRIGLRESLVEEAVAKAYGKDYAQVRRANMLTGDISAALRLAAEHRLEEAQMRLFHPIGLMLATPVENSLDALDYFTGKSIQVEDKYDGIRAQVHVGPDPDSSGSTRVRIFSRTMDDVTDSFPELAESLRTFPFPGPVILDGEILAWDRTVEGRALPFSRLQQRLGRKTPGIQLMREVPVAYVAFDVLYADGELVIEKSLRERGEILDRLFNGGLEHSRGGLFVPQAAPKKPTVRTLATARRHAQQHLFEPAASSLVAETDTNSVPLSPVLRAPIFHAESPEALDTLFDSAQARGNEGLMIKDVGSPYTPGRRGKSWLKLKRELATLDVVVTSVEYGHGKRAAVLSDVTFAVRDSENNGALLNVGKAYSGLTDVEIAELTQWFKQHTISDYGHRLNVEPNVVLEVAFNNVMVSDRHESGYALRFPRILRLRPDKPVSEIDTLDRVREIYEKQHGEVSTSRTPASNRLVGREPQT